MVLQDHIGERFDGPVDILYFAKENKEDNLSNVSQAELDQHIVRLKNSDEHNVVLFNDQFQAGEREDGLATHRQMLESRKDGSIFSNEVKIYQDGRKDNEISILFESGFKQDLTVKHVPIGAGKQRVTSATKVFDDKGQLVNEKLIGYTLEESYTEVVDGIRERKATISFDDGRKREESGEVIMGPDGDRVLVNTINEYDASGKLVSTKEIKKALILSLGKNKAFKKEGTRLDATPIARESKEQNNLVNSLLSLEDKLKKANQTDESSLSKKAIKNKVNNLEQNLDAKMALLLATESSDEIFGMDASKRDNLQQEIASIQQQISALI